MFVVAVVIVVLLACGVLAVVAVGQGGRYADKNPKFTEFASRAVKHLNGDGEPPAKFIDLVER
ncbi:MAG: hypothetical protein Q4B08_03875 [Propionibacteriaceae bacterium]|nr:hypothetical protein [Propionibacteriaceae bacterium]